MHFHRNAFPPPLPPLSFSSSCSSLFACFSFSSLLSPLSFAPPPLVSSHPVLSPYSAFFSAVGVMSLCNANQLWRRQHSFSPPSPPAPLSSSSSSSFLSSPCYLFSPSWLSHLFFFFAFQPYSTHLHHFSALLPSLSSHPVLRVCVCCLSAVTVSSSALESSAFFQLLHKNTACHSKKKKKKALL